MKACQETGIHSEKYTPPETVTTEELLELVGGLNARADIDVIPVQLPLPRQVDSRRLLEPVAPENDVDSFDPLNVGHLVEGRPGPGPCTPSGIMGRRYGMPAPAPR